jgi:hypothetical protein
MKRTETSDPKDAMNPAVALTPVRPRRSSLWLPLLCGLLAAGATHANAAANENASASAKQTEIDDGSDNEAQVSEVQSKARPFGIDIVSKVMEAGSDRAAENFQENALPSINALLSQTLGERQKVDAASYLLDPSKLQLKTDSDVRVYFVGEGAGYQNTLGFNTTGSGITGGDPLLIFPNASSPVSTYDPLRSPDRTRNAPLLPGDFVDLGKIGSGSLLDFFLIADGANGGKNVYSTDASSNPDKLNHVVSFAYAAKDSPYLIIGFEDLYGGGDRDYNDLIFAVDIGMANIAALTGTPEPALVFTLAGFLGGVFWLKRRNAPLPSAPRSVVA